MFEPSLFVQTRLPLRRIFIKLGVLHCIALVQGVYYREYRDLSVVTVGLHLTVLALATSCATLHLHQLTDPVDLLRLDLAAPVASIRQVVRVSSVH